MSRKWIGWHVGKCCGHPVAKIRSVFWPKIRNSLDKFTTSRCALTWDSFRPCGQKIRHCNFLNFVCLSELFHTERSHVRNLKVLDRVFYRPLLDNGFSDLVNLLFPNLPDMLEIHGRFNTLMKARKRDQPAVETVGDILVAMVRIPFPLTSGWENPMDRLVQPPNSFI